MMHDSAFPILSAAPEHLSAGTTATLTGGVLVAALTGGIVWYCVKHRGRDWPTVLMGYVLCIAISGLSAGNDINNAASQGLTTAASALVSVLSSVH